MDRSDRHRTRRSGARSYPTRTRRDRPRTFTGDQGGNPGESPILTADEIEMGFGDVSVLEGVSIALLPGRVTALVGPNGSGKTTLLRVVAGLVSPDAGTVRLHIRRTTDNSPRTPDPSLENSPSSASGRARFADAERLVGYLPQRPAFRESFTVEESLRFYADLVDEKAATVADRLGLVGLDEVADRRVGGLSGGMTRLLGLAQATVGDPPVVVLDEPTSGLDPQMTTHVFSAVDAMATRGQAVLLATHDLAAVEEVLDDVLVLDRGRVLGMGSLGDVCTRMDVDDLPAVFAEFVSASDGITVRASSRESHRTRVKPGS